MGKIERDRFGDNKKCMLITSKKLEEITEEEKLFLKEKYTGFGSLLPKFDGGNAQFFTPRFLCKFITDWIEPKLPKGASVLEPSIGTGNLISYFSNDKQITGLDVDIMNTNICKILYPNARIINGNSMEFLEENAFDLVIGNPPFNITIESERKWDNSKLDKKTGLYKGNSDALFVEQAIKSCKTGGYILFILPPAIQFKSTLKKIREYIWNTCWVLANIELPEATFAAAGTNIKTNILLLRKAPEGLKKVSSTNDNINKKFILGQPPIMQAIISDVGFDKKGNLTIKPNEDGEMYTQLDDLLDQINERDNMFFENECPHPNTKETHDTYFEIDKSNKGYEMEWWKDKQNRHRVWNVETLGRGMEIECDGEEYKTWDWSVMDKLIKLSK